MQTERKVIIIAQKNTELDSDSHQNIIIRSLSMTNYLVRNGFKIKKVDDSTKDIRFKVFLFADSFSLRKCMEQFPCGQGV